MRREDATILVVDDVADNRSLLVRRLGRMGLLRVDEAENGVEALAAIARRRYDLVLLDIMMPLIDGFGVLEALKHDGRIEDLPVIVISAINEIEPVVRCIELGAEDFLLKPFNPTLLRARVNATLEKKALRDRLRADLERNRRELAQARTLQLALTPGRFDGEAIGCAMAIEVALEPANEIGGDLADHFRVGDDLRVLLLGDVSDKGAGAALMMARTHALFRGLAQRPDAGLLFREPERAMAIVNAALVEGNAACSFVTMLMAVLDTSSGALAIVRAGHVPPFHRRASGAVERLRAAGGPPLGVLDDAVFASTATTLMPGERLLIVTDGITEANDAADQAFGDDAVAAILAATGPFEDDALSILLDRVLAFEDGRPAADDKAAILLSMGEPPDASAHFEATIVPVPDAVARLNEDAARLLRSAGVDDRSVHHVGIVIEEILTNLESHGSAPGLPATVHLQIAPDRIWGAFVDSSSPFNPAQGPEPDLTAPVEDREAGGLGLLLVRTLASDIRQVQRDGRTHTLFSIRRPGSSDA